MTQAPSAPKNSQLGAAKAAKNDEFYTQWADVEREMNAYLEYDPAVFRGKVILLPCDDPEWSNFTKFFALHFGDFGLKKLISTSFAPDSNPWRVDYQPTLFESESPAFDAAKTRANGKKFTLEAKDISGDGVVNIDDLQWEYLEGDGDFRSPEVTALRDEADMVVTNPPFSLLRPFMTWLFKGDVLFSVIGLRGAITYREVFPHIRDGRVWLGRGFHAGNAYFAVPGPGDYADGVYDPETGLVKFRNTCWFTNIDHGRRHEPLQLMTTADNLKFNKKLIKKLDGESTYQRYENFDAIDVPYIDAIPSDYDGMMGVPITLLDVFNPDQFEIIGNGEGYLAASIGVAPLGPEFVGNEGRTKLGIASTKQAVFKRIVIRHRRGD